ncbi:MAG: GumC family protein [Armatimonadota bacterium]
MAEEETRPRHLELPDYIRILSKRKWFILIVTAVMMLVGGLYALSRPRRFEATSLVHVQQRPEGFFWVSGETADIVPNMALETYGRMARSTEVAEAAAERLQSLPRESRVITDPGEIRDSLEVSVIKPDLLRITATSPMERKATAFANEVARAFVRVNTSQRQEESTAAREFLEEQVAAREKQLQKVIDEMAAMSAAGGFVDLEAEIAGLVSDLREYENRRRQAQAEVAVAGARVSELSTLQDTEEKYAVTVQPTPNPAWQALSDEVLSARVELQRLESQYTDGHPRVLDQKALVQELQQELDRTPPIVEREAVEQNPVAAGLGAQLNDARITLEAAQSRLAATREALAQLKSRIEGLPEEMQRWQALNDRLVSLRDAYLSLQEELRQAQLAEAIEQGNARVIDTAQKGREIQVSPGKSLLFAGALGLFVGLALAILLEALDDTIYSVEDLQRVTDLYLLGIIPLRTDEAGSLVAATAPKSPPAEAYRTLRSNIRFSLFDRPARTFLVTSAGTGEGKSVTAANLGIVYAQSGDSVIVVDTDLRRPVMHRFFELDAEPGVTNVLVGDAQLDDVLQDGGTPGLKVITSGPLPPNPAELLESDRMTRFIEQLSEMADVIIFDSPPAVMLTDAGILSAKVDTTILVAESGQVTERAVRDMERLFEHARADILGIVLNKLRVTGGDYYYYYYYYYYYDADRSLPEANDLDTEAAPTGPDANLVDLNNAGEPEDESESSTDQLP